MQPTSTTARAPDTCDGDFANLLGVKNHVTAGACPKVITAAGIITLTEEGATIESADGLVCTLDDELGPLVFQLVRNAQQVGKRVGQADAATRGEAYTQALASISASGLDATETLAEFHAQALELAELHLEWLRGHLTVDDLYPAVSDGGAATPSEDEQVN